jgi:hypothetical protein
VQVYRAKQPRERSAPRGIRGRSQRRVGVSLLFADHEQLVTEPDIRRQEMTQTTAQGRDYQGVSIPPAGTYELDGVHTVVGFLARHMLSKVRGQFTEFTGTIQVGDSPEGSRVEVEVQTQSITTHTEKRDQHLRNGDFLDVEQHPVLRFTSTAVRPTGGSWFELEGELTIKDITRPVTLSGEFLGWGPNMQGSRCWPRRPRPPSIARTGG